MADSCPLSVVQLTAQTHTLGTQEGFNAYIGGIAVDEQFIYATHSLLRADNMQPMPEVGHLVIFDRTTFSDPSVAPVRVPVGIDPRSVTFNPNNGSVYVANRRGSLSVVQRAPGTSAWGEVTQIKIAPGPVDVIVNPVTNRVYVSDWMGRKIHVINSETNTELAPITDPANSTEPFAPLGMVIDPDSNTLYVALSHRETPYVDALAVITLANDTVQSIRRVPITPPRSQPQDVAFNPLTKRLYVSTLGAVGEPSAAPSVTVIDSTTLATLATIHTVAGVPSAGISSLAVDTKLNKIYIAVAGSIQVIDGATNRISSPIKLTRALQSIALDPQTGQIFSGDKLDDGKVRRLTPLAVDTPIGQHSQANPQLGAPLAGPQPTPDGQGLLQPFEGGTLVSTADWGAVAIAQQHAQTWTGSASGNTALAAATLLAADIGNPISDSKIINDVQVTYFERGMIVTTPINGQSTEVAVSGPIWGRYRDIDNISSFLKLPISHEEDIPGGGRYQAFDQGHAYYRADVGVHFLSSSNFGPVHDAWLAAGGLGGWLGYPITDERRIPESPQVPQRARMCQFEHGAVIWNADLNQTFLLPSEFVRTWLIHNGSEGPLGLPVSDPLVRPVPETQARYVNFEHGVLVWFPAGHPLAIPNNGCHVVTSLELFVSRFSGVDKGENDEVDLYVRYFIDDTNGLHLEGTLPDDGENYGKDDVNVDFRVNFADVVRGDLWLKIVLRGRDDDGVPDLDGDDTLGAITLEYSIDNLWGIRDGVVKHSATDTDDNGIFHATLVMRPHEGDYDPNKSFRSQWYWKFGNFETPTLSVDVYDRTFSDVDAGLQVHFNPLGYLDEGWELLFYHLYKGAAKPGNCFGMCLEAIYANAHRSAFAEPIYQHDFNQVLMEEINIKHGYQVGAPAVRWYPTQIIPGTVNDGREVFHSSKAAYERGDWPMISMVRSWQLSGHAVLPIRWVERSDQLEIWLADPSKPPVPPDGHPEEPPETNDDMWKIVINRQDGSWTYRGSYNSAEPRWLFYMPFSLFAQQPRTPSGEAIAVAALAFGIAGTALMLLGDADTHQISDASGRTLYTPGLGRRPETPLDLRSDADGFIPNLSRVPLLGAEDGPVDGELHIALGRHDALVNEVVGRSNGIYHWGMRTTATAAIVSAPGSTVPDRITAEHLGTMQRAISFQNNAADKQIKLLMEGLPGTIRNKQFLLSDLTLVKEQQIRARIDNGGQELLLTNNGPTTSFRLQLRNRPDQALTPAKQVALGGGKTIRVRPANWDNPAAEKLLVEVRNAPDGPPEECLEV